jgi:hypothetical protein
VHDDGADAPGPEDDAGLEVDDHRERSASENSTAQGISARNTARQYGPSSGAVPTTSRSLIANCVDCQHGTKLLDLPELIAR